MNEFRVCSLFVDWPLLANLCSFTRTFVEIRCRVLQLSESSFHYEDELHDVNVMRVRGPTTEEMQNLRSSHEKTWDHFLVLLDSIPRIWRMREILLREMKVSSLFRSRMIGKSRPNDWSDHGIVSLLPERFPF